MFLQHTSFSKNEASLKEEAAACLFSKNTLAQVNVNYSNKFNSKSLNFNSIIISISIIA
jgi:hypothetical protein